MAQFIHRRHDREAESLRFTSASLTIEEEEEEKLEEEAN